MATYNTVIKKRNAVNNGWDSILPITTAENVLTDEQGGTVATHLAENVTDAEGTHGLKIESGTWTPVFAGSTVAGSNTYAVQVGNYYKVGKLVFVKFHIKLSSKDANMAGNLIINGLPFVAGNGTGSIDIARVEGITLGAYTHVTGFVTTSMIALYKSGGSWDNLAVADMAETGMIEGSAIYTV
jgi:hypothetical protein